MKSCGTLHWAKRQSQSVVTNAAYSVVFKAAFRLDRQFVDANEHYADTLKLQRRAEKAGS